MKLPGLLTRSSHALPGVTGIARVDRRAGDLLRRVGPGDIVVFNQLDVDRRTADTLVAAEVAGVVNAAASISGRFPNLGPEILIEAGIRLIDNVGSAALHDIKEGSKLRLYEGKVYTGERELAKGTEQTAESIADQMIEAKAGMSAQLEAFSANTMEFLRRERAMILEGVGVPNLYVTMKDREVLVVAPGKDHAEELKKLKRYIKEHNPVLIGVESGADTLKAAGYKPQIIVGDPDGIRTETLLCGAEVVVPAQTDGHATGIERVQDLGIGAVTFPASGNAEDLALLLADAHGASLVVTIGSQATLAEFLDRGRSGSNPSTFLTRLKLGSRLVDGKAVATLHRARVSTAAVLLLITAAAIAILIALTLANAGENYDNYQNWLGTAWRTATTWTKGLFQ
jgi:uncharacterized membrane-anchored protein